MSLIKYIPHPGVVLVLCAILMTACGLEGGNFLLSWVVFHCWAIYFFSGCTIPNGGKAVLNYMIGAFACPVIVLLIMKLTPMFATGSPHPTTIACSLVAFCLIFLEKVPFANNIPATFCGASAFFALGQIKPEYGAAFSGDLSAQCNIVIRLFIGILVGCLLGWATVLLRNAYGKLSEPAKA